VTGSLITRPNCCDCVECVPYHH